MYKLGVWMLTLTHLMQPPLLSLLQLCPPLP
jgi:hypothetical protein